MHLYSQLKYPLQWANFRNSNIVRTLIVFQFSVLKQVWYLYSLFIICSDVHGMEVLFGRSCSNTLKVALDGGTRPGDTLQILPLALAQPPNSRSITSPQGTPFTHPPNWLFQGHSVGHSFTKDNNWNCNLFFLRKYAFQMKNIKHTLYIYMHINLLYSLCVIIICT